MTRSQLQSHEDGYLTATAYAKVLGCELTPVQYAAAVHMEPAEYDEWRLWLLSKGWGEEWLPKVLPTGEELLKQWEGIGA
jgi:hypothetical protein